MKKPYEALLFDMDGILIDVTQSYRKAIQQTASYFLKREVDMTEVNEIKSKVGMNNDWDATYGLINNRLTSYEEVKKLFQNIYWGTTNIRGLIQNEKLLVSRKQLLQLKRIYLKMGIATGRPREEAQYILDRFKLNDIFEVLIVKEDTEKEKPFPDPILKAMDMLQVRKTIYIGDSPSDVVAATAAKIPCIYVGKQDMGTVMFESMSEVIDYLL